MDEACRTADCDHLRAGLADRMVMTGDPLSASVGDQFPNACKLVDFMSHIFTLFCRHSVVFTISLTAGLMLVFGRQMIACSGEEGKGAGRRGEGRGTYMQEERNPEEEIKKD